MFQIGTVQTSSYQSRISNARSWSIKICAKRPKAKLHLFVSLSVINVELLQIQCVKETYIVRCLRFDKVCTVSIWNMLQKCLFFRTAHHANLKHVSGWHMFQNGTQHTHFPIIMHSIPQTQFVIRGQLEKVYYHSLHYTNYLLFTKKSRCKGPFILNHPV